jgi:FAD:protein FMN transferase
MTAAAVTEFHRVAPKVIRRREAVMGTVVSFDVRPGNGSTETYLALAEARAVLHRADAVFSLWKPNSPMSRLRRHEIDLADAPAEVAEVLERCRVARNASAGWFDPWAIPGGVDPTGLVKGWAADRALDCLARSGAPAAMINAGGDVAVLGRPEPGRNWRIGIQDPWAPDRILAIANCGAAMATSGLYQRGPHVIDPRSGRPASAGASATVTGPRLDLADALATGLLAAGQEGLRWIDEAEEYEGLLVHHDGSVEHTPGFPLASVVS